MCTTNRAPQQAPISAEALRQSLAAKYNRLKLRKMAYDTAQIIWRLCLKDLPQEDLKEVQRQWDALDEKQELLLAQLRDSRQVEQICAINREMMDLRRQQKGLRQALDQASERKDQLYTLEQLRREQEENDAMLKQVACQLRLARRDPSALLRLAEKGQV